VRGHIFMRPRQGAFRQRSAAVPFASSTSASPLVRLGYMHVPLGGFDRVYPFFCKPSAWPSTHHVHVCEVGSAQEASHLAFRNYLREDSQVAAEYVALKRRLAELHHGTTLESRERYSLAKSEFVASVLARGSGR